MSVHPYNHCHYQHSLATLTQQLGCVFFSRKTRLLDALDGCYVSQAILPALFGVCLTFASFQSKRTFVGVHVFYEWFHIMKHNRDLESKPKL